MVRGLLERGHRVVATSRKGEFPCLSLSKFGSQLRWVKMDVLDQESIRSVAQTKHFDTDFDLLINNAGVSTKNHPFDLPLQTDSKEFLEVFQTNCIGPLLVCQRFFPLMKHVQNAQIVNVSSSLGSIGNNLWGDSTAYRASKAALNMVTRNLALQAQKENSQCQIVAIDPGWVQTEMGCSQNRQPPLTIRESASAMLLVIENLTPEQSGGFLDHYGNPLAW